MIKYSRLIQRSMYHRRILLVDDDVDVRMGTKLRLCSAGFQIDEAGNGRVCVARAAETLPRRHCDGPANAGNGWR